MPSCFYLLAIMDIVLHEIKSPEWAKEIILHTLSNIRTNRRYELIVKGKNLRFTTKSGAIWAGKIAYRMDNTVKLIEVEEAYDKLKWEVLEPVKTDRTILIMNKKGLKAHYGL